LLMMPLLKGKELWGMLCIHQCSGLRQWQASEIEFAKQIAAHLAGVLYLEQVQAQSEQLLKASERERAVAKVIYKIRTSADINAIFKATTQDVRRLLGVERITIYKFRPDYFGDFVTECESGGWPELVGSAWEDPYLQEHQGGRFRNNEPHVVDDIYNAGLTDCHVEALEHFGVKAFAVVAIMQGEKLWGLLSAFQHSEPRHWEEGEVSLMLQIGGQLGQAIQRAEYVQQLQEQSTLLAKAAEQERSVAKVIEKIRNSSDIDGIFKMATQQIRELLQAERVVIFRFEADWSGKFVAESVVKGWTCLMQEQFDNPILRENISECSAKSLGGGKAQVPDTYLQQTQGSGFAKEAGFRVVDDIYQAGFSTCYIEMLERYQARAYVIVPVVLEEKLWGLLAVYQNSGSRNWEESEVKVVTQIGGQLGQAIQRAEYVQQLQEQSTQLAKAAERERWVAKVIDKIRNSSDINAIFKTTTQDVRRLLDVERITIYKFRPDYFGDFVTECETGGWPELVGSGWEDPYLQEHQGGRFRKNEPLVVDDVYNAGLDECHVEALEQFGVKACAVVAIMQGEKLWGLLSAFQHSGTRHWEEGEVKVLTQIGGQLGLALQRAEYLQQLHEQSKQLAKVGERERSAAKVIEKIRASTDVNAIFQSTTKEVRKLIGVDRVTIYKFRPDYFGDFVVESESGGLPELVGSAWEDPYLQEHQGGRFRNNEPLVVDDVYNGGLTDCHVEALENFGIKACVVIAIMQGQKLWGLLSAFQHSEPRHWEEGEVKVLAQIGSQLGVALQQGEYVEVLRVQSERLAKSVDRGTVYSKLVYRIGLALIQENFSLERVLQLAMQELRRQLKSDRVAIYQFNPDWSGEFVFEDVGDWPKLVGTNLAKVEDTYLQETKGGRYRRREILSVDNIHTFGHEECHIQLLEQWGAKAYVIAPIFKGDQLWGLLGVYQNDAPRQWEQIDINLVGQVGLQIGLALQQAEYLEQLKTQAQQLAESSEREKIAKETLQNGIMQLLSAVRPALRGDLTVRATVTEDEVGTVADAYNNTLQSLRQIVRQVQIASRKVAQTSQDSEASIADLASQAQHQFHSLSFALEQIQTMIDSTSAVGTNAQQVEVAVQEANQTVREGDAAMNRTVDGIINIRETVAETSKRLTRLSESSQKVSKVVNLISSFTTQTQILALNAAIEATRAGEYGRGFGVVADEVRSLARQSAAATTEIEQLVQEIQEGTAEVSIALEKGIQQVAEGTATVQDTREHLNAIVEATSQISHLVEGITQVTQVQTQQFQSVAQTMTEVSKIANDTSENSVEISTSFKDLLAMAQNLQSSADQFKVD
jgi:methyl-accepting chemotaxis protein PixJ